MGIGGGGRVEGGMDDMDTMDDMDDMDGLR